MQVLVQNLVVVETAMYGGTMKYVKILNSTIMYANECAFWMKYRYQPRRILPGTRCVSSQVLFVVSVATIAGNKQKIPDDRLGPPGIILHLFRRALHLTNLDSFEI